MSWRQPRRVMHARQEQQQVLSVRKQQLLG